MIHAIKFSKLFTVVENSSVLIRRVKPIKYLLEIVHVCFLDQYSVLITSYIELSLCTTLVYE